MHDIGNDVFDQHPVLSAFMGSRGTLSPNSVRSPGSRRCCLIVADLPKVSKSGKPPNGSGGAKERPTRWRLAALDRALIVRQAQEEDVPGVARLCADVFTSLQFSGLPPVIISDSWKQRTADIIEQDVMAQLLRAIKSKQKARMEAKEFRINNLNAEMRAEIDHLLGRAPVPAFIASSSVSRRAAESWRRKRQFACILAVQKQDTDPALGCAMVSLAKPEAFLPPPWPSKAPLRCCVSNLAVSKEFRRQGIARKILQRCEILAHRWGFEDIWLFTEVSNATARQLYIAQGYRELRRDPGIFGPFQRVLLSKNISRM